MTYETVQSALVQLLGDNLVGEAHVVGYQPSVRSAESAENSRRNVMVFYQSGNFSKAKSPSVGILKHDVVFKLAMMVSATAKGDLRVLENSAASDAALATATTNLISASEQAEAHINALWDKVWNIIRRPENKHLGLGPGTISDLWISNFSKGEAVPRGSTVLLSASADVTLSCIETPTSATPKPGTGGILATVPGTRDPAADSTDPAQEYSAPVAVKR